MSLRKYNPFSSGSGSISSIRPPTYTSVPSPQPDYSFTSHAMGDTSAYTISDNATSPDHGALQDEARFSTSPRFSFVGSSIGAPDPSGPRYLYYRVYTENGEFPSKHPINPKDPSLARIKSISVAPPHNVASIKRCLCSTERIGDYNRVQIFADLSSENPMGEGYISLLAHNGPGATPEWPMVIVRPPLNQVVRAMYAWAPINSNSAFLAITPGEILHTDGIIKSKSYAKRQQDVYKVLTAAGTRGCE